MTHYKSRYSVDGDLHERYHVERDLTCEVEDVTGNEFESLDNMGDLDNDRIESMQ